MFMERSLYPNKPMTLRMENTIKNIKIGSWNLCLGLPNKKDLVTKYLNENNIAICCLQETEVPDNFPELTLNSNGYILELEQNVEKKRAGIYIAKGIKYTRKTELEESGHHILIVDVYWTVSWTKVLYHGNSVPKI